MQYRFTQTILHSQDLFCGVNETSENSVKFSIVYIKDLQNMDRDIEIVPEFIGDRYYFLGYIWYKYNHYKLHIKSK